MGSSSWLSFSLSLLLVLHGTFAQQRYQQQQGQCQLNRLNPQEPTIRIQAEAGVTERGERGEGSRFQDRHQKIGQFRQGTLLPLLELLTAYNEGNEELVLVCFEDSGNSANQLDQTSRRFFIAGNPQQGQQGSRSLGREQFQSGNVFSGFEVELLAEAFGVDRETARKLQGQEDQRGHIVNIEQGLRVVRPPFSQEQEEREERQEQGQYGPRMNGIEETICSAKVRQNIDNPARADIYNPHAGRFTTVNSFTLPILSFLRLSAARGVLYRPLSGRTAIRGLPLDVIATLTRISRDEARRLKFNREEL
ncbi:hypothetical protein HAX54_006938 [Datura stramonium]|uniref:Cupin type-1 domain-containing protein n=1 Tax=Datura stramonium TaxID=4076 RepID=A0ABS8WX18_DATST|nr:hypothetical protein [Datura stramonium]